MQILIINWQIISRRAKVNLKLKHFFKIAVYCYELLHTTRLDALMIFWSACFFSSYSIMNFNMSFEARSLNWTTASTMNMQWEAKRVHMLHVVETQFDGIFVPIWNIHSLLHRTSTLGSVSVLNCWCIFLWAIRIREHRIFIGNGDVRMKNEWPQSCWMGNNFNELIKGHIINV